MGRFLSEGSIAPGFEEATVSAIMIFSSLVRFLYLKGLGCEISNVNGFEDLQTQVPLG